MAGKQALTLRTRRVHDDPEPEDGLRVLVDRLWPRGLSKEKASLDGWAKELAPSTELRRWYHADQDGRDSEFRERYAAELSGEEQRERMRTLIAQAREGHEGTLTLLTAVRDAPGSYLAVLADALREEAG